MIYCQVQVLTVFTTTVNNNGEPTFDDMMAVAERVGLNRHQANEIIEEVNVWVKEGRLR